MTSPENYFVLARNAFLLHELAEVLERCREKKLEVMLLKGAALLALGLAEEHERPMNDIDIFVKKQQLDDFTGVIMDRGFRKLDHSHCDYLRRDADPLRSVALDIHTSFWHTRDTQELWNDAIPVSVEGVKAKALSLEDMLLHCIAHSILHSAHLPGRALADMAAIAATAAFKWDRLAEKTNRYNMGVMAKPVLLELKKHGMTEVPDEAINGIKIGLAHLLFYPLFFQAAARRAPCRVFEYVLPVIFRPRIAFEAFFPEKEIIVARFGKDTKMNRIRRPLRLLADAADELARYCCSIGKPQKPIK